MKKEEFIFCPLGGSGEIGMNMNLYAYGNQENRKWIIVDIGVTFADDTIPGVDLIYADPGFIVDKKEDLIGLVLTHAHEDHIGAIAHIWPKLLCNIYATPFTSVLIKEKFKEKKIDIEDKLKIVELNGKIQLGPFNIEFVTLTHSILEPNGLSIQTSSGTVLHTGDWKCDPNPLIGEKINEKKLKQIGDQGVLAMICDSTNVFNSGRSGSELDVRNSLLKIMINKQKRIIITSFASNVARMESVFYCAKKIGRQISLVGRSMHRIYKAAKQCGYLNNLTEPVDARKAKNISREKIVYLCTGNQGEPNGAMMRISNGIHPDVFIEPGDTVIFSSKIIPGNEKKLYGLHNLLVKNNIEVISEENEFVHVSGHPNREDLKDMYNWVKPKSIIPVHGEYRHMSEHINFARKMQIPYPVKVENGDMVQLFPGEKPKVFDKAPVGRIYVDGNISVGEESQSIKDRKNLSYNGFLEITIIINNNGSMTKKPIISFRGIPNNDENSNFVSDMEDQIRKICKTFSLNNSNQEYNLIEALKTNCRKIVKEKTGKRPYTNINLVRI
ncbi:MAG: ribonuclease J [Pelagibacteraceae bacterium]|jgi:ribonuclease J|nr:ribonuclease J [Pelagibacteraceae bacterium]MDP6709785.1 ribonuclease J [Pelagibacteraceae bacterium]|tara:strand:- start:4340 stop:6004 length:1665 start_codon:yes stop_codon:yes gene_type:complete